MSKSIQTLIKQSENPKLLSEAFEFAKEYYRGVTWLSGEDYIEHAVRTAMILHAMGIDEKTIIATLLYNTINVEEKPLQEARLKEIKAKFGDQIAMLAQKSYELNKAYYSIAIDARVKNSPQQDKIENIRKMFFAIAGDLRVVLMKLAARIDGLQNIKKLTPQMQEIYATETIHIFVPIASRLGLGEVKRQLEDLAFECLDPKTFSWLVEHTKEKYEERQKYLKTFIPKFKKFLGHHKIKFLEIDYRAKSYWSTWQKLQRYQMDFEKIYDLVALRLIVRDVATCYKALGVIHEQYQPLSGQIQDYIAKPKENGYQSLHTTVGLESDRISEIQIKTEQMHREAKFGICAHWAYKEKVILKKDKENLAFAKNVPDFLKTFKIDFFENRVFTFTPKGEVISLPKGATAVDFAYAVHSDIGNHCEGAKIGGKIIPLSQELKNGDIVEIITSKHKKPSQDWLGFVKTRIAKSHIKKIAGVIVSPIFSVPAFVRKKIFGAPNPVKTPDKTPVKKPNRPLEVYVAGQKGITVSLAKCCAPKTEDRIKAYLAKNRPAMVHSISCDTLKRASEKFPDKIVGASWEES